MKILRKCIAFALAASLILSAMSVFAADGDQGYVDKYFQAEDGSYPNLEAPNTYETYENGTIIKFYGSLRPDSSNIPADMTLGSGCSWTDEKGVYLVYENGQWVVPVPVDCNSSFNDSNLSSGDFVSSDAQPLTQQDIADIQSQAEAAAVQHAASDEGFADVGDMFRAAEKGMSAGEFYNNVVVSTPGIENAITVGQGGNLVVNGKVTNMSATISKVTNRAYVDSVRVEQEGTVLNVVDVSYPAVEATINFYTPGITDGMEIVALQYNAGTWINVEVAEVRADHVVLNMKGNGVIAFIAK